MQTSSFQLISNKKIFTIPSNFRHSDDISQDISKSLENNPTGSYQIISKVRDEIFQEFLDFLIQDKIPNVNYDNICEFLELSNEFGILKDFINSKKNEYEECKINLNGLHRRDSLCQFYEQNITLKLDDYIENYGADLMKSPLQSLYNIFKLSGCRLTKQDLAYETIVRNSESPNKSEYFILLEFLDGSKLSTENLKDSILHCKERCNYKPHLDIMCTLRFVDRQSVNERKILDLEKKLNEMIELNETFSIWPFKQRISKKYILFFIIWILLMPFLFTSNKSCKNNYSKLAYNEKLSMNEAIDSMRKTTNSLNETIISMNQTINL